jgi:spermidine/putrescine transport system substrate-binding protein
MRRAARAAAGTLAGLALALACGAAPAGSELVLRMFNWNNYMTEGAVQRFEALCGCRLAQDYYSDNEEMLAKLAAGATGYDLIVPTGNAVEALLKARQLRPLDRRRIPNLANVDPRYLDPWFDPGNVYSAPYAYSLTILGYNVEKLRERGLPTDSWAVIFEPKYLERIAGKVTVLDSQRELFAAALKYLGDSANTSDPAKLRRARDLILRAKPYWAAFNAASYFKELTVGNIWLAHGYSTDFFTAQQDARAARRKFHIGYAIPREGAVFALDNLVIHRSARHPELAEAFINYWLEGGPSAELSSAIGAGSPNRAAMARIDPQIAANPAIFPDAGVFRRLEMLRDHDARTRRLLNRLWVEIKVR